MKDWAENIRNEVLRRICEESIPRIIQCLGYLSDEEINHRPNKNCNAINNLIIHLNGNVRQWVLASAAQYKKDDRIRNEEFNPENRNSREQLIQLLDILKNDLLLAVPTLSADVMMETRKVQCYEETVLSMLIHATEHFSYHTGQIVSYTKLIKDVNTAFYGETDLSVTN